MIAIFLIRATEMEEKIRFSELIQDLLSALSRHNSILIPTDTVYGLVADGYSIESRDNLYEIKRRSIEKTFAIFIHAENSDLYFHRNFRNQRIFEKFPYVTFIVKNINKKLQHLEVDGKIGIRVPNSIPILRLLKIYDKPLIATSANISGDKAPTMLDEVSEEIINHPLVFSRGIQNHFDCIRSGVSSSIFDISEEKIRIIREGSIKLREIENFLLDV